MADSTVRDRWMPTEAEQPWRPTYAEAGSTAESLSDDSRYSKAIR